MTDRENGVYIGHVACPKHGGSDSLALYEKSDNVIDGHCWASCGFISTEELEEMRVTEDGKVNVPFASGKTAHDKPVMTDFSSIESLDIRGWRERKIKKETCEYYGVRTKTNREDDVIARYYPVTKDGKVVGYKCRKVPKDFVGFGYTKRDSELFGQHLFPSNGKYLLIATGEEDALAFAQAMRKDNYWTACVSVTCGDGSAINQIKANYDYVNSFEKVVLAFDGDDAGQSQVGEVAKLLKPGKAYIVKWPPGVKDACDLSSKGKFQDLRQAFWKAEPFSRVDVLHLAQMWDDFENEDSNIKIPFPAAFHKLNEMLNGGMERGEVTVIGARTSEGKSSIVNSIVYHIIEETPYKVGVMYLEGTKREVVRDLLSLDSGINLRKVDRGNIDMNALRERFFNNLAARDKFVYVDHQGSISTKEIFEKFSHLSKVEGCDVIVIDPIQAGVNSSDNSAIIEFMDTLLKFAKETDTAVICVSHMRKPANNDPHDVNEYDLLGSSSINQIAFNTVLISRDKLDSDHIRRNATRLLLVKCRRTGDTGEAGWIRYDPESTRFYATPNPYLEENTLEAELDDFGDPIAKSDDSEDDSEFEQESF